MKISVRNIGCKTNFAEISEIASRFVEMGFERVDFGEKCDIIIVNTCTVTLKADADSRKTIRKAIRENPEAFVAVAGCYSELQRREILKIEGVDAVFGANDKFAMSEIFDKFHKLDQPFISSGVDKDFHGAAAGEGAGKSRAILKIQDGCDYKCAYCIVSQARGTPRCMTLDELLARVERLELDGFREIVLSGINLGTYDSGDSSGFAGALLALTKRRGSARFRISSIEPNLLDDNIIEICASSENICRHFHIPLQSGSDKILRAMRRRYDSELFENRVATIKRLMPDACVGADLIAGLPGEGDAEFAETFDLLERIGVDYLHAFAYSERPGTDAAKMPDKVPAKVAKQRTNLLRALSERKRLAFYSSRLGSEGTSISDGFDKTRGLCLGKTGNYVNVKYPPPENPSEPTKVALREIAGEYVLCDLAKT